MTQSTGNPTSRAMHGAFPAGSHESHDDNIKANFRIFQRAVVLHTLNDPSQRDAEKDVEILNNVRNSKDYVKSPRNSIICRILNDGQGKTDTANLICYPFFPSHFMIPVKAGEQVWVFTEQPGAHTDKFYWICRITESLHVEDVNFTHGERRWGSITEQAGITNKVDDGTGNFANPRILTFQNGPVLMPSRSPLGGNDPKIFNKIIGQNKEKNMFYMEPVPRLTKKPGDFVLQGSNNSSITLGTLSGWDYRDRPTVDGTKNSSASGVTKLSDESLGKGGSIDLVVGRGQVFSFPDEVGDPTSRDKPKSDFSTKPLIVQNEIGFEVDKNVATQQKGQEEAGSFGNAKTNPQEGDPDFILDASRILLASAANVDLILETGPNGVAKSFDPGAAVENSYGPSIALKTDHVRIVARKTKVKKNEGKIPSDFPTSAGSIRIIKEGEPNADLASIVIQPNGDIQISGNRIFIGRNSDDGGKGNITDYPYVKYKDLEKLWKDTMTEISAFCQTLTTHTTPGFGFPSPQITQAAATLKAKIDGALKNQITDVKSERIFGE